MPAHKKETISVSNRTVIRVILLVVATFLFLRFLQQVSDILVLILTAFFLAIALNPTVSWITKRLKSKSRVRATAAAYVTVLVVLITFVVLIVPPLVRQTVDFANDLPATVENFKTQDNSIARFARRYKLDDQFAQISRNIRSNYGNFNLSKPILSTAERVGSTLISIITVLVMSFMMLVEAPMWLEKLWAVMPAHRREHNKLLARRMYRVVTGYVNGQVLLAAIASAFALTALLITSTLFNVSLNVVALAGIVFFFGLIPLIGNTLAAVIVVLFCLFSSPGLALAMLVYFLLYQQVENATLAPYIQSKSNNLTPLLVFVSAIIGAGYRGLFGALIAIPLAGCLRIIIEDYLARRSSQPET